MWMKEHIMNAFWNVAGEKKARGKTNFHTKIVAEISLNFLSQWNLKCRRVWKSIWAQSFECKWTLSFCYFVHSPGLLHTTLLYVCNVYIYLISIRSAVNLTEPRNVYWKTLENKTRKEKTHTQTATHDVLLIPNGIE